MIRFRVPAAVPGACRSWRKTINAVNPDVARGFAVEGQWVTAETLCEATGPGLLLAVDVGTPEGNVATVWEIASAGLTQIWRVVRKGPWSGPATIKALAKLAAGRPACHVSTLVVAEPNTIVRDCFRCHQPVAVGEGTQWRYTSGWVKMRHDQCPPVPNVYAGMCARCGGWIEAGEGKLAGILRGTGWFERDRWLITHLDTCPPEYARAHPPDVENRWDGRCYLCHKLVPANSGLYVRSVGIVVDEHGCVIHQPVGRVRHRGCRRRKRRKTPGPRPLGGRPISRRTAAGPRLSRPRSPARRSSRQPDQTEHQTG